jgi:hypothetical protein
MEQEECQKNPKKFYIEKDYKLAGKIVEVSLLTEKLLSINITRS